MVDARGEVDLPERLRKTLDVRRHILPRRRIAGNEERGDLHAGSATQALSAVRSGLEADVLVSDYLMPGMTGGQLIHELRGAGVQIPALLVTGYAAAGEDVPADVQRLSKPFRQVDLAARVDDLLRPCTGRVRLQPAD
ncbi:MAG: response regulator [Sphingomonas sp.]|nr:MAG: response regulator [Sphingomonas sp.]